MAVKKKAENLTIAEKLAQALVPESEQPYKVPKNWCWTTISNVSKVISKGTTPSGGRTAYVGKGIAFLRVENLNDDGTISHNDIVYIDNKIHCEQLKRSILMQDDVLVSIAGTLGKTGIVREIDLPMNTNQAIAFIRLHNSVVLSKYIKYLLDSPVFKNLLVSKTKVTSIPNLTLEIIGDCVLPLPPFGEQQHIVERIESLFVKLDDAKEKLQEVLDGFEIRKAAILHKAFSGELTAKWREEHSVSFESWENTNLGKYATAQYGFTESATNELVGPKFLRITDIQNGKVNWEKVPYCKIDEESKDKYKLNIGDIVVARTGATTGKCYLIVDDVDSVFASFLIRVSVDKSKIDTYYLYWFMQSQQYWAQITELSAGIAQPGVNGRKLVGLHIPIPTIEEQMAIVNLLNNEFAKEAYVKTKVECVVKETEAIKKSILIRAFRGELGTNNENDESAIELIKTIL